MNIQWVDSHLRKGLFLLFILLVYGIFGTLYVFQVPPFEAPDELAHFLRAVPSERKRLLPPPLIAQELPLPAEAKKDLIRKEQALDTASHPFSERSLFSFYENHQPPVYYQMMGFFWRHIPGTPMAILVNPYFFDSWVNLFYRQLDAAPPFRTWLIHFRLMRACSLFFLLAFLVFLFFLVQDAFPGRPLLAMLAVLLPMTIPQMLFTGAIINNDMFGYLAAVIAIFLCQRVLLHGPKAPLSLLMLVLWIPVALFIKYTVLPIVLAFLLYFFLLDRSFKLLHRLLGAAGALFAALVIYLLEPAFIQRVGITVHSRVYHVVHGMSAPFLLLPFLKESIKSFFAVLGWKSIYLPAWYYLAFALLSCVGVIFIVRGGRAAMRDSRKRLFFFHLTIAVVVALTYAAYGIISRQPQGRLMLQALPSLIILGLAGIGDRKTIPALGIVLCVCVAFFLNVAILFHIMPDAYNRPEPLAGRAALNEEVYIFPGMGFRRPNARVFHRTLSVLDVYCLDAVDGPVRLVLSYTRAPGFLKRQLLLDGTNRGVHWPVINSNRLSYTLPGLAKGRNRLYVYLSARPGMPGPKRVVGLEAITLTR